MSLKLRKVWCITAVVAMPIFFVQCNGGGGGDDPATSFSQQPPKAPSDLEATAISDQRIDLEWTDHSNNESGFVIERGLDGSTFGVHAQVSANTTSFSDTVGLSPKTVYFYRIKAFNSAGASAYCGPVQTTTLEVPWARSYGGPGDDFLGEAVPTADGGYILAGQTLSFGSGSEDVWIVKLDADGDVIWQKAYGGSGSDIATSIIQSGSGEYYVSCTTRSFGAGAEDIWILKLNADGQVLWQKTYGEGEGDCAGDLLLSSTGELLVVGCSDSFGTSAMDYWILELDEKGGVNWQNAYNLSGDDEARCCVTTLDGGYLITGYSSQGGPGAFAEMRTLKLNSTGNIAWEKAYQYGIGYASAIASTVDGGFIVGGTCKSSAPGTSMLVWKLDGMGDIQWQKLFSGDPSSVPASGNSVHDISPTGDGGFILSGSVYHAHSRVDLCVVKLDATGAVQWDKLYDGVFWDDGIAVSPLERGGFMAAGNRGSANGDDDYWILLFNADGSIAFNPGSGAQVIDNRPCGDRYGRLFLLAGHLHDPDLRDSHGHDRRSNGYPVHHRAAGAVIVEGVLTSGGARLEEESHH